MTNEPTTREAEFLHEAAQYLENPSFLMRLADGCGKPLEWLVKQFEKIAPDVIEATVRGALQKALELAIATIPDCDRTADGILVPSKEVNDIGSNVDFWSKLSVMLTGTTGGLFGLPGLAVELPITTTAMLRSIAATAKEFGEDLTDPEIRLHYLSVFAYGGPSSSDDALESSYLTARLAMQAEIAVAAKFVAGVPPAHLIQMIEKGAAPRLVQLLVRIAAQFNITVTQKMLAQTLPIVGGLTGGVINVAFIGHFNRVARFHFGMRSLERKYGSECVQSIYREKVRAIREQAKPLIPSVEPA